MTQDIKKDKIKIILLAGLFIALVIILTIMLLPYMRKLSQPEVQQQFKVWVEDRGFLGILAVFGIQVVQIVLAFIPGEPIELLAGVLYGSIGGLLICLVGCVFASSIVFSLSKRFGRKVMKLFFKESTIASWSWLKDNKKIGIVTFILFLMPGTPKDLLTYIVGISNMKLARFIILSTFARIPSIISSSIIGSTIRQGKWVLAIALFVVTGIIGIVCIFIKDKVELKYKQKN